MGLRVDTKTRKILLKLYSLPEPCRQHVYYVDKKSLDLTDQIKWEMRGLGAIMTDWKCFSSLVSIFGLSPLANMTPGPQIAHVPLFPYFTNPKMATEKERVSRLESRAVKAENTLLRLTKYVELLKTKSSE